MADLDEAQRRQIATITSFHPDFWGLDLEATFPELKRTENPDPKSKFIDSDGNVISKYIPNTITPVIRINRYNGDIVLTITHATRARPGNTIDDYWNYDFDYWNVDIFNKKISPVDKLFDSKGLGNQWTEMYPTINSRFGAVFYITLSVDGPASWPVSPDKRVESTRPGSSTKEINCHLPLSKSLALYKEGAREPIAQVWPFIKNDIDGPILSGGPDCDPPAEMHSFNVGAEVSSTWEIFPLPDGTFLAWEVQHPRDIIRLDRRLRTPYRSPHFILLDKQQWQRLPLDKGDRVMENVVLSLFDHEQTRP
jgi:hypothetical protein